MNVLIACEESQITCCAFRYKGHNAFSCDIIPFPFTFFDLPKPSDLIQPYEFGEPYSKATYLWLKNLPPLFKTDILSWHESYTNKFKSQKVRSKTFPGIAKAFADQWG